MSLADDVLATHRPEPDSQAEYDNCSGCAGTWPCESVRLALSLQAAERVVEAWENVASRAHDVLWHSDTFAEVQLATSCIADALEHGPESALTGELAEYDKGGQG